MNFSIEPYCTDSHSDRPVLFQVLRKPCTWQPESLPAKDLQYNGQVISDNPKAEPRVSSVVEHFPDLQRPGFDPQFGLNRQPNTNEKTTQQQNLKAKNTRAERK